VNTPRARAVEALRLIKHFDEFLDGETSVSPVFMDKSRWNTFTGIYFHPFPFLLFFEGLSVISRELPMLRWQRWYPQNLRALH